MADTARQNLKDALASGMNLTTGAVKNTLDLATKATDTATKLTGSAVDATGVLGTGAVTAATEIGATAIQATSTLGTAAVETGATVGTTALATTGKVADAALSAAGTISSAATKATTDIAVTALDTTTGVAQTTTEQVGKSLNAAVDLVGNTVTRTLGGLDTLGAMAAGKGANIAKSTFQKQGAEAIGIAARQGSDIRAELLKTFGIVETQMMATVKLMHGVQKTALAAQINVYKRAKCGFFRRMTGFCDAGTIGKDMGLADIYFREFEEKVRTAGAQAKTDIQGASPDAYSSIEATYNTTVSAAVKEFVSNYRGLLDKYNKMARQALGMPGGRRKKRRTLRQKPRRLTRRR